MRSIVRAYSSPPKQKRDLLVSFLFCVMIKKNRLELWICTANPKLYNDDFGRRQSRPATAMRSPQTSASLFVPTIMKLHEQFFVRAIFFYLSEILRFHFKFSLYVSGVKNTWFFVVFYFKSPFLYIYAKRIYRFTIQVQHLWKRIDSLSSPLYNGVTTLTLTK